MLYVVETFLLVEKLPCGTNQISSSENVFDKALFHYSSYYSGA